MKSRARLFAVKILKMIFLFLFHIMTLLLVMARTAIFDIPILASDQLLRYLSISDIAHLRMASSHSKYHPHLQTFLDSYKNINDKCPEGTAKSINTQLISFQTPIKIHITIGYFKTEEQIEQCLLSISSIWHLFFKYQLLKHQRSGKFAIITSSPLFANVVSKFKGRHIFLNSLLLDLELDELYDKYGEQIMKEAAFLKSVDALKISVQEIDDKALEKLLSSFNQLEYLKSFLFISTKTGLAAHSFVQRITDILSQTQSSLKSLDLTILSARIDCKRLIQGLKTLRALEELNLRFNFDTFENDRIVMQELQDVLNPLTSFGFSYSGSIEEPETIRFINSIARFSLSKRFSFNVRSENLGPLTILAVRNLLLEANQLQHINLHFHNRKILDLVVLDLIQAISMHSKSLNSLQLVIKSELITDVTLSYLKEVIPTMKHLERLNLNFHSDKISRDSIHQLRKAMISDLPDLQIHVGSE